MGKERDPLSGVECNLCLPAIDPTPVDCEAAEQGVEFLPVTIWDFDASRASNLYAYTDNSAEYWNLSGAWQPNTEQTERCRGQGTTGALHVKGGPFLNWGGGVGRHLKCLNGSTVTGQPKLGDRVDPIDRACDSVMGGPSPVLACASFAQTDVDGNFPMDEQSVLARTACPERDQAVMLDGSDSARSAAPPEEEFLLGMTLDLTEWDGISFWARRSSNDAQTGFRIVLGDKHTDDDLSYLQYHINPDDTRYCERNVECGCPGNTPCTTREASNGTLVSACWDAPVRLDEGNIEGVIVDGALVCGDAMCQELAGTYPPMQAPDMQIAGATCNPFVFRGGFEDLFCYDKEDGQLPVERTHMCGDHWVHPVRLSTEWQFYKIPFGVLLQEGWAKESFKLDLTSAAVVRFTWGPGWPDFWVDDVRFYRNLHNTSGGR